MKEAETCEKHMSQGGVTADVNLCYSHATSRHWIVDITHHLANKPRLAMKFNEPQFDPAGLVEITESLERASKILNHGSAATYLTIVHWHTRYAKTPNQGAVDMTA
jgi:hypothetical protein